MKYIIKLSLLLIFIQSGLLSALKADEANISDVPPYIVETTSAEAHLYDSTGNVVVVFYYRSW